MNTIRKIVEWALNNKSIYKENWSFCIDRSHTNKYHCSAESDQHFWTDLIVMLKFSLHWNDQNLNLQQSHNVYYYYYFSIEMYAV